MINVYNYFRRIFYSRILTININLVEKESESQGEK